MSSEKQGLTCELCGKGPFKSLAGLAGHAWLAHQVRPGGGLAGVEGKQLVEAQEQLGGRMTRLEAAVGGVGKIVSQLVERHEALAKQEAERVEALTSQLVERGEALMKQQAERVETLTKQLFERHEKAEAAHREQFGRVLAAHRERDDEQHEELSEGLEKLERVIMPLHIRAG